MLYHLNLFLLLIGIGRGRTLISNSPPPPFGRNEGNILFNDALIYTYMPICISDAVIVINKNVLSSNYLNSQSHVNFAICES